MAQNTRELRRRIKSTKSIRQITKAMEMIAASKMRKAQLAALASRPYANLAWEMLSSLSGTNNQISFEEHKELARFLNPIPSALSFQHLILLITSNRGLCGSLNSQLVNAAFSTVKSEQNKPSFIIVGRKGLRAALRLGWNVKASFSGFENQPTFEEARAIAKTVMDEFIGGEVGRVSIIYADFISTLQYKVRSLQLLPITREDVQDAERFHTQSIAQELLFEPSPQEVLTSLVPRLIELQVYRAILENLASEHSARMVATKNASDSARDIINDLTLTYNSLRQASITSDLADIIGGRMAVK